jgi:hypothetical protein
MNQTNIVLRLTRSQQMALVEILVAYIRMKDQVHEFVDVINDRTTTTGQLLGLVSDFREVEIGPTKEELGTVLTLVLDCVDYTSGACRLNEMVGAVLPKEILERALQAGRR